MLTERLKQVWDKLWIVLRAIGLLIVAHLPATSFWIVVVVLSYPTLKVGISAYGANGLFWSFGFSCGGLKRIT